MLRSWCVCTAWTSKASSRGWYFQPNVLVCNDRLYSRSARPHWWLPLGQVSVLYRKKSVNKYALEINTPFLLLTLSVRSESVEVKSSPINILPEIRTGAVCTCSTPHVHLHENDFSTTHKSGPEVSACPKVSTCVTTKFESKGVLRRIARIRHGGHDLGSACT